MNINASCPKCGGEEWKAASVVYADGIASTASNVIGGGIGSGGVGVGVGKTSGSHQTELSKKAAPPQLKEKPRTTMRTANKVAIWSFVGFLAAIYFFGNSMSDADHPILFFLFFVALPGTSVIAMIIGNIPVIDEETRENHRRAMKEYEQKKVCMRCGEFYISKQALPETSQDAQSA